jgi:hypothetical protein
MTGVPGVPGSWAELACRTGRFPVDPAMARWRWWIPAVAVPAGMFLGLFGAAAISYVTPRQYESRSVLQVLPVESGRAAGSGTPRLDIDTEIEVVRTAKTLEMVVEALDLALRWGVDSSQAIEMLRPLIEVRQIRGTDLLELRVRHTNAVDARDIAVAVGRHTASGGLPGSGSGRATVRHARPGRGASRRTGWRRNSRS